MCLVMFDESLDIVYEKLQSYPEAWSSILLHEDLFASGRQVGTLTRSGYCLLVRVEIFSSWALTSVKAGQ